MAGDLFGLSAADRDVLLRMIARERANYSANVRNLAPVPREKNIWKPSATPKVAWLNTLRTSYTYTGGGSEKELQFTSPLNASDGTMDLLETVASSGYYTKIELSEPGIYQALSCCTLSPTNWSYSTADFDLSSAFDEAYMRIEVKDRLGNEVPTTANKTQYATVFSGFRFSLTAGGVMNLAQYSQSLFPVTARVMVNSTTQDFTAASTSGTFWILKIRDRLDD